MAAPQTEQQLMQADSKFRYYASLMDKALKSFEYTHEWADLISALAKINKVGTVDLCKLYPNFLDVNTDSARRKKHQRCYRTPVPHCTMYRPTAAGLQYCYLWLSNGLC